MRLLRVFPPRQILPIFEIPGRHVRSSDEEDLVIERFPAPKQIGHAICAPEFSVRPSACTKQRSFSTSSLSKPQKGVQNTRSILYSLIVLRPNDSDSLWPPFQAKPYLAFLSPRVLSTCPVSLEGTNWMKMSSSDTVPSLSFANFTVSS